MEGAGAQIFHVTLFFLERKRLGSLDGLVNEIELLDGACSLRGHKKGSYLYMFDVVTHCFETEVELNRDGVNRKRQIKMSRRPAITRAISCRAPCFYPVPSHDHAGFGKHGQVQRGGGQRGAQGDGVAGSDGRWKRAAASTSTG